MSTNYNIIKNSEKQLSNNFLNYFNHIKKTWTKLLNVLKTNKYIDDAEYDKFVKLEEKSNRFESTLLDQCIWNISSNQPLASHLRFVVSIINSLNNLERMGDYIISSARFIHENKANDKKVIDLLIDAIESSYVTMNKIIGTLFDENKNLVSIKKGTNYDPVSIYGQVLVISSEYRKKYKEIINEISKIIFEKKTVEQIQDLFAGAIIVIKYTERNVDHAINIVENFIYIRESNFFYEKYSKYSSNSEMDHLEKINHKNKKKK